RSGRPLSMAEAAKPKTKKHAGPAAGPALKLLGWVALGIFLADRISKYVIVEVMDLGNRLAIDVLPPFLNLRMAWNRGINFGIGAGGPDAMRWVLVCVAVIISAALVWWIARRRERMMAAAAGVVVGGAIGNAWDRVQYGAVADFLNMSCCGIHNPYAFNIADIAIFAGAIYLAWKA
ncbi:MAG: signal peptidase II, partial [Pseudomonadota bacterium]